MERATLEDAKMAARRANVPNWETLQHSRRKGKRFSIVGLDGRLVNFGSETSSAFLDHRDPKIREAWQARHSKIVLKDGRPAHEVRGTPSWYAWRVLW